MFVETMPVGPLQCNCSIVACPNTNEALVIDPGGDVDRIVEVLKQNNLTLKFILHTHAHFDHVMGTKELQNSMGGQIVLHPEDRFLYENLQMQAQIFGFKLDPETPPIDINLKHQMRLDFGQSQTLVLHTPGHTPGSVCFHLEHRHKSQNTQEHLLFSGDTLFRRGIGRTDLPGGSSKQILESITKQLYALDGDTKVVPGHGPGTLIGEERMKNPFVTA